LGCCEKQWVTELHPQEHTPTANTEPRQEDGRIGFGQRSRVKETSKAARSVCGVAPLDDSQNKCNRNDKTGWTASGGENSNEACPKVAVSLNEIERASRCCTK
jgi:hypothetical protein